jgi:hypothetical protein
VLYHLNYDNTSVIVEALDDLFDSLERSIDLLESKDSTPRSVQILRDRQRAVGSLLCEIRPKLTHLAIDRMHQMAKSRLTTQPT